MFHTENFIGCTSVLIQYSIQCCLGCRWYNSVLVLSVKNYSTMIDLEHIQSFRSEETVPEVSEYMIDPNNFCFKLKRAVIVVYAVLIFMGLWYFFQLVMPDAPFTSTWLNRQCYKLRNSTVKSDTYRIFNETAFNEYLGNCTNNFFWRVIVSTFIQFLIF